MVLPQSLDGAANFRGQDIAFDLSGLDEDGLDVVLHALVLKGQLKGLHGLENDAHGLNSVAENDFLERLAFIARVATLVDQLHLLENGRLSRFTSTCQFIVSRIVNSAWCRRVDILHQIQPRGDTYPEVTS